MFTKGEIIMSIKKRKNGNYSFECMVKGQRYYTTYICRNNETLRDVKKKFKEWKNSQGVSSYIRTSYTFEDFAEIWVNEYCVDYSPLVIKNYRCNLKNWILPWLGRIPINEITPLVLDGFLNHLKSSKNMIDGQALSNGSIQKIWQITHTIITTAFMKDLIPSNPCQKVRLTLRREVNKEQLHFWNIDTYRHALSLLAKEPLDNARVVEFAAKTGLRRSEIWGLTWNDINFQTNELSINKTLQKVNNVMKVLPCKTKSSVRTIVLPSSLIPMLKKYREAHPNNVYIFQNLDYDAVTKWFREWQPKHGIDKIRFHDLRHTHATLLLYQGINIKAISERLGHSNIGITMNVYTHVVKELDTKAAEAIDEIA